MLLSSKCHFVGVKATTWQSQDVRGSPAGKAGFQEVSCPSQKHVLLPPCNSMQKETSAFGDLLLLLYFGEFRWILWPQCSTGWLIAGLLPVLAHSHHLHDSGLRETEQRGCRVSDHIDGISQTPAMGKWFLFCKCLKGLGIHQPVLLLKITWRWFSGSTREKCCRKHFVPSWWVTERALLLLSRSPGKVSRL